MPYAAKIGLILLIFLPLPKGYHTQFFISFYGSERFLLFGMVPQLMNICGFRLGNRMKHAMMNIPTEVVVFVCFQFLKKNFRS